MQHATTILSAIILAASSGCGLAALQERNQAIENMNQQAAANAEAAQARARTEMYVIASEAWLCPEAEAAAAAATECAGGTSFERGAAVRVIGQAPEGEVWRAEYFDAAGQHKGYVLAEAIGELPDTSAIDDFRGEVDQNIPDAERIPGPSLSYIDFLERPEAFEGRKLVMEIGSSDMKDKRVESGLLRFIMLVPAEPGSRNMAPVLFELSNAEWTSAFESGKRSYSCGSDYCDHFVIVARLTERQEKKVDQGGNLKVLPVFQIEAMADRFGRYDHE